jgi:murein DD-endopeptidase MepM/ murein hydrolase activator NlpD
MFDPYAPYPPSTSHFWKLRNDARAGWRLRDDARPIDQPWRWPLERIAGRDPVVLAERVNGERQGIDLGYESRPYDAELFVPVYATQTGEVTLAGETQSGFMVTIDHSYREWATHYAHLSRLFVAPYLGQRSRRRQRIRGGEVIGYAAKSPIHVRFEIWNWTDDRGFVAVDPIATMRAWSASACPLTSAKEAA